MPEDNSLDLISLKSEGPKNQINMTSEADGLKRSFTMPEGLGALGNSSSIKLEDRTQSQF